MIKSITFDEFELKFLIFLLKNKSFSGWVFPRGGGYNFMVERLLAKLNDRPELSKVDYALMIDKEIRDYISNLKENN